MRSVRVFCASPFILRFRSVLCFSRFNRVRAEEIRVLLKAALLRAINEALFFVQPALLATIVFGTYNFLGNDLKPSEV